MNDNDGGFFLRWPFLSSQSHHIQKGHLQKNMDLLWPLLIINNSDGCLFPHQKKVLSHPRLLKNDKMDMGRRICPPWCCRFLIGFTTFPI